MSLMATPAPLDAHPTPIPAVTASPSRSLIELGLRLIQHGMHDTTIARPTIALVVDIDDFVEMRMRRGAVHAERVRHQITRAIEQALQAWEHRALVVPFDFDEYAILLAPPHSPDAAEAAAIDAAWSILTHVREEAGHTVSVGIGQHHAEPDDIGRSLEEAMWAMRHKLVLGGNRAIAHRDWVQAKVDTSPAPEPPTAADLLVQRISRGELSGIPRLVDRWLYQTLADRAPSPDELDAWVTQTVLHSLRMVHGAGGDLSGAPNVKQLLDGLQIVPSIHELSYLTRWLEQYFGELSALIVHRDLASHDPVDRSIKVIEDRYAEKLTLSCVAHEACVSPFHLSRLFRQSMGVTFLDYLTDYRIRQAKRKLRESQDAIEDVAAQVGYSDARHFSRLFKRRTGMTPTQYRLEPAVAQRSRIREAG